MQLIVIVNAATLCFFSQLLKAETSLQDDVEEGAHIYTIEGKVFPPEIPMVMSYNRGGVHPASSIVNKWQLSTVVDINCGEYKGFLQEDGSFIISGIPSGSYVLEINNSEFFFEPIRVEINPKGKFRARKVNYVQPSKIIQVPYPLKLKARTKFKYFQTREQWKITDFLFSPMVIMMLLPVFLLVALPKLISDPETKKELENIQLPKINNDMPEISEMITSYFTRGRKPTEKKSGTANKPVKKRN